MIKLVKEIIGFLTTFLGILLLLPVNITLAVVHTFSASSGLLFTTNAGRAKIIKDKEERR